MSTETNKNKINRINKTFHTSSKNTKQDTNNSWITVGQQIATDTHRKEEKLDEFCRLNF